LPAPFGPISPTSAPDRTASDTPSTARTPPYATDSAETSSSLLQDGEQPDPPDERLVEPELVPQPAGDVQAVAVAVGATVHHVDVELEPGHVPIVRRGGRSS
jgi:hypothetical protein